MRPPRPRALLGFRAAAALDTDEPPDGTQLDPSSFIAHAPQKLFPHSHPRVVPQHAVLGVSLGGHCAWHCLLHEPAIKTGVVVGTADYVRLMHGRARNSHRPSFHVSNPPGSRFLGSADFPRCLVDFVRRYDLVGLLLGHVRERLQQTSFLAPHLAERSAYVERMQRHLGGKRILNLAGGADTLVPYAARRPFVDSLKAAFGRGGWFSHGGLTYPKGPARRGLIALPPRPKRVALAGDRGLIALRTRRGSSH